MSARRLVVALLLLSGCDLDVDGAFSAYCAGHNGCDAGASNGGGSSVGGGTSNGGGSTNGGGGATAGGTATGGSGAGGGSAGGGAGGSNGGGAGGGLALSQWCESVAQAIDSRAARCASVSGTQFSGSTYAFCSRSDRPRALLGYQHYDPVVAMGCVANLADAGCNTTAQTCPGVFTPASAVDAGCEFSDCTPGGFCPFAARSTPGAACPVCQAVAALGDPCPPYSGSTDCVSNTWCATQADGGGLCVPRKADGQPCMSAYECGTNSCIDTAKLDGGFFSCGAVGAGGTCADPSHCASGFYCAGLQLSQFGSTLLQAGICAARIPLGSACSDEQLDDGCVVGSCLDGLCVATDSQPTGASCDSTPECRRGNCSRVGPYSMTGAPNLSDGTCVGDGAMDEPCSGYFDCAVGLYCATNMTCQPTLDAGSPCTSLNFGACGVHACAGISDGGGLCLDPVAPGAPCTDAICPATYTCASLDGGAPVCQRFPNGHVCSGPPFCETFRCAAGICAPSCF